MKNPCETCIEATFCRGILPCRKKMQYDEWKRKAVQIREHMKRVMERNRKGRKK